MPNEVLGPSRTDLVNHARYCIKEKRTRPDCPVCHGNPETKIERIELLVTKPVVYNPNKTEVTATGVIAIINKGRVGLQATTTPAVATPGLGYKNPALEALDPITEDNLSPSQKQFRENLPEIVIPDNPSDPHHAKS